MKGWLFTLALLITNLCLAQTIVQGTVNDETAQPLAGASIRLLNTAYSATSDAGGRFRLLHLAPGTYTLQVTATGYSPLFRVVTLREGTNELALVPVRLFSSLEEVVVTAQKREELLQRLPLSVTALSGRKAEEYRLWTTNDLTAVSSNLYTSHPGDYRNVTSVRGIVNTSYDQAVATYIDGVSQFGLDTYIPHLFDIERIEVVKGPQGTLYGRNAMGGVVNIITRKPTNHTDGFAQVGVGNYAQQRYSAGVRVPLVKNKLFAGAAGLYDRTGGFYTNEFNHTPYDKRRSAVGNYYLRYTPGSAWVLSLNAKHSANRNNGAFPLVFGAGEAFANPFRLSQNATTQMVDNVFNASLSASRYGKNVQLISQTAYQSNHRYYTNPIDADFSPLDAISIINNYGDKWNKVNVLTEELNLQSDATANGALKWLVGSYWFYQDNPVKQTTRFGEQAQLAGAPDNNFSLISTSKGKAWGAAFYGQLTYAPAPKLELTAGLRYDHEKREQQVLGEYQKEPDPNPVFPFRSDTTASASFAAFSPRIGLTFYPSTHQTVYAGYSRGFRAGGLTPLSSDPSQPALYPFKPEYSNNVEAGWKSAYFDQKLFVNLALFHATVTDVQVPTLVLPAAVAITRNTGRLVSKGVEAELQALVFHGLSIDYRFGYTHARYRELKLSQNGNEVNLAGKQQLFTPDVTSMLAVQKAFPLDRRQQVTLVVRGEWKYLGTHYFDLANAIRQPSYHLLNTRFGLTYRKAELMFWGRNLADEHYIGYAYDFGAVHLGDPKTYGVTLAAKF